MSIYSFLMWFISYWFDLEPHISIFYTTSGIFYHRWYIQPSGGICSINHEQCLSSRLEVWYIYIYIYVCVCIYIYNIYIYIYSHYCTCVHMHNRVMHALGHVSLCMYVCVILLLPSAHMHNRVLCLVTSVCVWRDQAHNPVVRMRTG